MSRLMVHRALLGSVERFFGILIEHYAGAFPLWLAPVQVEICPVSEKVADYANHVTETLKRHGLRVHLDDRNEKLPAKIRDAQLQKIPYMLVVGAQGSRSRHRLRPPSQQRRPRPQAASRSHRLAEKRSGLANDLAVTPTPAANLTLRTGFCYVNTHFLSSARLLRP